MKKITAEELKKILDDHQHYLHRDCEGWQDKRANFSHMNLSHMDLYGADLRDAIFTFANLTSADLTEAKLRDAIFAGANLAHANLQFADLSRACLRDTDLTCADLKDADLTSTDLTSAYLCGTNLYSTSFGNANITNACFRAANLECAVLNDVIGRSTEYITGKILTESIIGYKKCIDEIYNDVIVTLEIPKGAIVFSINGKKCRTNRAKVIAIGGSDRAYSTYKYMSYYPGDEFNIKNFNCMYNVECAEGIHFFTDKQDAEDYS